MKKAPAKGFGIAALVLGIISIVFFWAGINFITAILAIVFGAIYVAKRKEYGKGFGIAGIILGGVSIVIGLIFWALVAFVAVNYAGTIGNEISNDFNSEFGEEFNDEFYDNYDKYYDFFEGILDGDSDYKFDNDSKDNTF